MSREYILTPTARLMAQLPEEIDVADWLPSTGQAAWLLAALVVLLVIYRKVKKWSKRRRPVRLHPKLQQYGGDDQLESLRRAEADKVVATSSTNEIVGFEIVRQIEAVFVDGFRRAEEAMQGLKAAAAMKGANAVINVRHEKNATGKWAASGDAILIRQPSPNPEPPSLRKAPRTADTREQQPPTTRQTPAPENTPRKSTARRHDPPRLPPGDPDQGGNG